MPISDFLKALPSLDLPLPDDLVSTHVIRSDTGLAVFFFIHKTFELPEHSHKGQWGTVLEGKLDLTVNGVTTTYTPGMTYDIPSGAPHSAVAHAGSVILDIFEEPDRYPIRATTSSA
jgi:quercetin dioxygenase-like cupin family protein